MQPVAPASRVRTAASTTVLLAAAALSGSGAVAAAPAAAGASAAAGCVADTPMVRHVVLFEPGTGVDAARAEVTASCGALAGYYPEIAVAVASTTDGSFADRLGRDRAYSAQAEGVTRVPRPAQPALHRAMSVQSIDTVAGAGAAGSGAAGAAGPAGFGEADRSGEQWNLAMIGAARSPTGNRASADVLVGVLDSGVDANHPELAEALKSSASAGCETGVPDRRPQAWRPNGGHGTHVAGIIAAAADGAGVTGVAPGVRLAAVKVVNADGFIYPESAVCGFLWAARNKMQIANHSYLVDPWLFTCRDEPGQSVVHEALRRAARYATSQGVLSVAAAGNEAMNLAAPDVDARSPNNVRQPQRRPVDHSCDVLPAELPDVLTVSAVGAAGVKASYSSYGAAVVDITAPGGDVRQRSPSATSGCVLSTVPGGFGRMCGTSMAAPHVTGVAALAASANPSAGPAELASIVLASATPLPCPDEFDPDSDGVADATCTRDGDSNSFYGAGLVNAAAPTP